MYVQCIQAVSATTSDSDHEMHGWDAFWFLLNTLLRRLICSSNEIPIFCHFAMTLLSLYRKFIWIVLSSCNQLLSSRLLSKNVKIKITKLLSYVSCIGVELGLSPCCSYRWGGTMCLNCFHQWAYCSYPGDIWVWSRCGKTLTGENWISREKKASQCQLVHHKFHMDWPGSPKSEAGDYPPEPKHNRLST
jgi:hypothetical protein